MSMRARTIAALLMLTAAVASTSARAQGAQPTVLFICEHGTVKSLLAKVLFDQYAKEAGLSMRAVSRGTNLEPAVAPWMQAGLAADHFALGTWTPQALQPLDLATASYVVSFDLPSTVSESAKSPRAQWDGLPSVSKNYAVGRDSIKVRIRQLVDSLKRARTPVR